MAGVDNGRRRPAPATVGRATPPGKAKTAPARTGGGERRTKRGAVALARSHAPRTRAQSPGRFRTVWASGQFVALLAALACGGAIAYLLTSRSLTTQALVIDGATATTAEQIAAASGVLGHNIFTIDPQLVAERLVALPTVREAHAWSELPDRLVVRIGERRPALVWQVGDERFLLDDEGFVIALDPPAETAQGLPRVAVRELPAPQLGGRVEATPLATALTIARRAPDHGLVLAAIEYAPTEGMVLLLAADRDTPAKRVIIGGDARLAEKLAAAGAILKGDQNWTTLNVTAPDRPFFPAR